MTTIAERATEERLLGMVDNRWLMGRDESRVIAGELLAARSVVEAARAFLEARGEFEVFEVLDELRAALTAYGPPAASTPKEGP